MLLWRDSLHPSHSPSCSLLALQLNLPRCPSAYTSKSPASSRCWISTETENSTERRSDLTHTATTTRQPRRPGGRAVESSFVLTISGAVLCVRACLHLCMCACVQARLGFTACFSDVHRSSEALGSPATVIDQQVQWLFAATSHADESADTAEISPDEFKACYTKLLHASYEEEVLLIDLQRAIDSLANGDEWTQAKKLLALTKQVFHAIVAASGAGGEDAAAEVQPSQPRVHAILQRLFAGIQGRSQVLGPRKQTAARRIVAPLFPEHGAATPAAAASAAAAAAAPASSSAAASGSGAAAAAPTLTLAGFQRLFKTLLALPVPAAALTQDAEASEYKAHTRADADTGAC